MQGLFVNTRRANCSIYSSGLMIYDSLISEDYLLDYVEINDINLDKLHQGVIESSVHDLSSKYDFYVFNYHNATMRDIENVVSRRFINLKSKTICIVLEMTKNNPYALMRPHGFTDLMVIDPTMNYKDDGIDPSPRVHAFPRPLFKFRKINRIETIPEIPIIGSFGFATIDKGFDLIVKAVANEFEKAHIRINLSPSTYADPAMGDQFKDQIENSCKQHIKEGIKLEFTRHFFNDDKLIDWCAENTLNCFFYTRNIPGLAAASDQAIISGAPLAVSENTTFRHIHQYIKPYPQASLKELMLTSQNGIADMQREWSSKKFVEKFKEVLAL